MDKDVYNPLERGTYEAIAYNAVGRASEIGTYPAYALVHSTGNSGWSVGIVQWDFGQPGRGAKADLLLENYQAWAEPDARFAARELETLSVRLKTKGQVGNALTGDEHSKLNAYLRSDEGRAFVNALNREQVDYKWSNVGEPLSRIPWLQRLSAEDPAAAAEIVAMTSKLFNQNEVRGGRLVQHVQTMELSPGQVATWIGSTGVDGLNPNAVSAIRSGRDGALAGIRLMNALEVGDGVLSRRWHDLVHVRGDVALAEGFNFSPDLQLFDAMLRHPRNGLRILEHVDQGRRAQASVIEGVNGLARHEMARIGLSEEEGLVVSGPRGFEYGLTSAGWRLRGDPQPRARVSDIPDHVEIGRSIPFGAVGPETSGALRESIEAQLQLVCTRHGLIPSEGQVERATACILRDAQRSGITEVTALTFDSHRTMGMTDPLEHLVAWQGSPLDPASKWTAVPAWATAHGASEVPDRPIELERRPPLAESGGFPLRHGGQPG